MGRPNDVNEDELILDRASAEAAGGMVGKGMRVPPGV